MGSDVYRKGLRAAWAGDGVRGGSVLTRTAASKIAAQMRDVLEELELHIDDLERTPSDDHVDALAMAWRLMTDGKTSDALSKIERILGELDSAWRTRT